MEVFKTITTILWKGIKHFVFIFLMSGYIQAMFFIYDETLLQGGITIDYLFYFIFGAVFWAMITIYYFYYCEYFWLRRSYRLWIGGRKVKKFTDRWT